MTSGTLWFSPVPAPKKPRKLAKEELFEYAVKCLTARIYSTGDLAAKLRLRAAQIPDVAATIDRLKEIGYVNDERFAESFATARVENDGYGKIRVLNDLRRHRIPGELADAAVEQALDGKSEAELIDAYIERRMPSVAAGGKIEDERKLASAFRRLRRAGFTTGPILDALKRLAVRPEVLDDFPDEEVEE
jgi:regulatory protein